MADKKGALVPQGPGAVEVAAGETLQKIETTYQTAIAVQKERDIDKVVKKCLIEAEFAGELFYYSWPVKDNKTGKTKIVEDLGINGALTIARNFGNCAAPIELTEAGDKWIFRASFVDLETGFTLSRLFERTRPATVGKWDAERWADMAFQAAQSRAQRNVILKGVPVWLRDQVLNKAKEAALKGIGKDGLAKAREKAVATFGRYGLSQEGLVEFVGKPLDQWTPEDLLLLRSQARMIQDGAETVETLFGEVLRKEDKKIDDQKIVAFWRALAPFGIEKEDPVVKEYLAELAEFFNESTVQVVNRTSDAWFNERGEVLESEVAEFVAGVKKRFPESEKKDPQESKKAPQDNQAAPGQEKKQTATKGPGGDKRSPPGPALDFRGQKKGDKKR